AQDQCHDVGACDPASGQCSNPAMPDGTACSDGDACTQTDTCQGGSCTGTNPVVCTAQDQCHDVGACDPASGQCSNPAKPNGAACTQTDPCQGGTCTATTPLVCTAQDQCHDAGACDPASGQCSNPAKSDGAACSDGDACTQADTCQAGACTGGNPVACTAQNQCHVAGVCDPASGPCSNPAKADGTACNDGDACTQTDTCQAGTCTGGSSVVCTAEDQCHDAGTCDPATGSCSSPAKPDGTTCDDGNTGTYDDQCMTGHCGGTEGGLRNFLCYRSTITPGTPPFVPITGIRLVDPFESLTVVMRRPRALCAVAAVNGQPTAEDPVFLESIR